MCIQFKLNGEEISQHEDFDAGNKVVMRGLYLEKAGELEVNSVRGITVEKPVYWDGWARRADLNQNWIKRGWEHADIYASEFCQMGRWYEVPSGEAIKAVARDTGKRVVVKVITRSSEGKESKVQDRFALTGHAHLKPSKGWPR